MLEGPEFPGECGLCHPVWSCLELRAQKVLLAWDDPHSLRRNVDILPFGTFPTWAGQEVNVGIVKLCPLSPLDGGALGLAVMLKA